MDNMDTRSTEKGPSSLFFGGIADGDAAADVLALESRLKP